MHAPFNYVGGEGSVRTWDALDSSICSLVSRYDRRDACRGQLVVRDNPCPVEGAPLHSCDIIQSRAAFRMWQNLVTSANPCGEATSLLNILKDGHLTVGQKEGKVSTFASPNFH
jgi:hypothetical protein